MKKCLLFIILHLIFIIPLAAGQADETDIIALDEIIVSATRTPASLDNISTSSSVIREEQIRSSTATDLGRLLGSTNILGTSDYGPGGFSTASLRGSSFEQVLVLVDGERINDSRSGGVDLKNIPIGYIKRVEVVRGGQSAMYGADAVGGVINIITNHPAKTKAQAWSTLGAYDFVSRGLEASRQLKSISGLISLSRTEAESDFPFEDKFGRELIRENADSMTRSIFGKLGWDISKSASLRLSGDHYYSDKGDPGPIGQFSPEAEKCEKSNGLKADFEQSLSESALYKLSINKRDGMLRYTNPQPPYPVDDTHKNSVMGAELQVHLLQGTSIPLIWGMAFRNDDISSTALGDQDRKTYSGYIQQELRKEIVENPMRLSKVAIFPAIRWDQYSDFEAGLSPRLGFLASFGQENLVNIKANAGNSYRAPTLNELYWPPDAFAHGNPDLKPEKSTDMDAGIHFHGTMDKNGRHEIRFGVSLFRNSFRDRIQWTPGAEGKWSPQNLSEARATGLETEMRAQASLWGVPDLLSIGINYTFLKAEDMLKRQLIYRPKHSLGYTLRAGTRKLWAQMQGVYQSRRYTTVQNTKWLDPFMRHDAQLGIERRLFSINVGIILEVRNILDKRYQQAADYPLPGREWSIKTSIGLGGE